MKRFTFYICLAFLLLLVPMGITSAASPTTTTTTTATTATMTTTPGNSGGSVFFETDPAGATIWVDNNQIGTSDLTFYSEKTGKLDVFIQRKGYEDFTGNVTVIENSKVEFFVKLTPLPSNIPADNIPAAPVVTATTTIRKSTMTIPTSWPETTESPVDPAIVIGAVAVGAWFVLIRLR